jgi:DNA-directed RNA polymerase specialized sigma24 family protein
VSEAHARVASSPLVRATTRNHPLAEDAVQEAAIQAWLVSEEGPDLPDEYLRRAGARRALSVMRGNQQFGAPPRTPGSGSRKPTTVDLGVLTALDAEPVTDPLAASEGRIVVEGLLALLTDRQVEVARLLLIGYTQREAAEVLGITEKAVEARVRVARKKLEPYREDLT